MLPLSLLFKRFLKIGATAYGGPAIAGQMKKAVVKESYERRIGNLILRIAGCRDLLRELGTGNARIHNRKILSHLR